MSILLFDSGQVENHILIYSTEENMKLGEKSLNINSSQIRTVQEAFNPFRIVEKIFRKVKKVMMNFKITLFV